MRAWLPQLISPRTGIVQVNHLFRNDMTVLFDDAIVHIDSCVRVKFSCSLPYR